MPSNQLDGQRKGHSKGWLMRRNKRERRREMMIIGGRARGVPSRAQSLPAAGHTTIVTGGPSRP